MTNIAEKNNVVTVDIEQPVIFAVYGTLKKDFGNSRILVGRGAEFLGTHRTEPVYTLYGKRGGIFPVAERNGNTAILCELYRTDNPNVAEGVFRLEGCTLKQGSSRNWYDYDIIDTPHGKAVIFVMDNSGRAAATINPTGEY